MAESYSGVQNFCHDFREELNSWVTARSPLWLSYYDYNHVPNSLEIEFCEARLGKNDSFCNWCEPLCDIHTIKPCENNWGSFTKNCCGLCGFRCDVECPVTTPVITPVTTSFITPVLLYVLASLFSVIGRVF